MTRPPAGPYRRARDRRQVANVLAVIGLLVVVTVLPLVSLLGLTLRWFTVDAWITGLVVVAAISGPAIAWILDNISCPADDPTFGWGGEIR